MKSPIPVLLLLSVLPLLASCGDSTSAPVPSRIVVSPGNTTMDALGLTQQFSARVEDKKGKAIDGVVVTWTSSDPLVASVTSGGLATGLKKGTATIRASAEGLTGSVALSINPIPAQVVKNAGDEQTGALSQPLSEPLEVEVRDSQGNPVVGSLVTFTVLVGGGSLSTSTPVTDAQGRATAIWTLGCSNDDPQRVRATSGGLNVEFTASADLSLPAICQGTIPDGRVTLPYSVQLEVVGGDQGTMTWSVESGSLPGGVTLSPAGVLSGVPTAAGSSIFRAKAQDGMGQSAARDYQLRVCEAPLSLSPGESVSLAPSGGDGCGFLLPAGSSGDRYRIGVLWGSSNPDDINNLPLVTVTTTRQLGAGLVAEPVAAFRDLVAQVQEEPGDWLDGLPAHLREAVEVDAATEAFHHRLREAEREMLLAMGPGAHPLPDLAPAREVAGLQSPAPDKLRLSPNKGSSCTAIAKVTALKVAENDLMAIYQDSVQAQVDSLKVTTALADELLAYYESYGQSVIDDYFGGVSDINGDGKIVIFATPVVASGVAAYVWSGDFFPVEGGEFNCPSSNQMELVYFNPSVIRGSLSGNYQALATVVHEAKHVSSLYKSIARFAFYPFEGQYYQPTWVEEGTAEIAGEMSSRLAWEATGGPAVNAMIRRSDKVITRESYGVLLRWVRTIFYLYSQPNGVVGTPAGALSDHSVYGSGWHFHRWLGDAYGEAAVARLADGPFFTGLNDSTTAVGPQGIRDATGYTWSELLEQYASAIMLNGTGAPQPDWAFTSYDFPDVTSGLLVEPHQPPGFYPWPVNVSGDNTTLPFQSFVSTGTIGPSGIKVYDLTSDGLGVGLEVEVEGTRTPLHIVVARIQ